MAESGAEIPAKAPHMNITKYEHTERIASYKHRQSLLRSTLLNFNTILMLAMVVLFVAGFAEVIHIEQQIIGKLTVVLETTAHPTPSHHQ